MKKLGIIGVIFLFALLIMFIIKQQEWVLKKIYPLDYSEYVYLYAEENHIDPYLIFAIIKTESNFNRNIKSSSGAIGLMQLMEATAVEMAKKMGEEIVETEALYNPQRNIQIGVCYYASLLKHYEGKEYIALAAYNAGMGNVDRWLEEGIIKKDASDIENIPYKETNNYIRKVIRNYKIYQNLYQK